MHTRRLLIPTAALTTALLTTGAAGGCGNSGSQPAGGQQTTQVAIQGNPASPLKCTIVLDLHRPVRRTVTATLSASCNFPTDGADVSLVIQGRPTGSGEGSWQNADHPVTSSELPSVDAPLTFTAICLPGYDFEASAHVDTLAPDGAPVSYAQTAGPDSYTAADCNS